jgi:hypothetical protein
VVTTNVEALLAENDALRREVRALRRQLELQQQARGSGLTAEQVARWSDAMARHPRWTSLRIGPPGGLQAVIATQRPHRWTAQQEQELAEALRGPHSRGRWAVRAAFALYGPRAIEWLNEAPFRVVEELLERVRRLEESGQRRRGTRTANHSGAAGGDSDPRRQALALLELEPGASQAAIKAAYRRLAKRHHPDLGGDGAAFQRLEAAYRLLIR